MKITIFGGASPRPGQPAYQQAERLGTLLARAGHIVITGGYIGTMEAISKGANQAGGHVIGVTCQQIEDWRKIGPNPWLTEEHRTATLEERMIVLMDLAGAVMALPGGIGTLAELSLLWNRLDIQATPLKPLILIGPGWRAAIQGLAAALDGYYLPRQLALIQFAATVEDAAALLPD